MVVDGVMACRRHRMAVVVARTVLYHSPIFWPFVSLQSLQQSQNIISTRQKMMPSIQCVYSIGYISRIVAV